MAMLIRWQFDGCNSIPAEGYDKWWTDMHIDGQLQCEKALSFTGKAEPCVIIDNEERYRIDLVRMVQKNMKTGRTRLIRRTVVLDFSIETHFFDKGRLRKRPSAFLPAPAEERQSKSLKASADPGG